jgi:hypothetical protein
VIFLFYADYVPDDAAKFSNRVRRLLAPVYKTLTGRQKVTGFQVWYQNLVQGLTRCGYEVVLNQKDLAARRPDRPVGLMGYPSILDGWPLENPAVLGPGLLDHPRARPDLMDDPRYRLYLTTCDWVHDMFAAEYGAVCVPWHGGIDTDEWYDTTNMPKDVDVLVYDKIRWRREHYEPNLLEPVMSELRTRGLRTAYVRYGNYSYAAYRKLLQRARSMVFLCEHETQGMAYQEAMSCGLPVLAWDQGWWLDPQRARHSADPIRATSVPYFSTACGRTFSGREEFADEFAAFWSDLDAYRPRAYVVDNLSLAGSAELYARYYHSLG